MILSRCKLIFFISETRHPLLIWLEFQGSVLDSTVMAVEQVLKAVV